MGVAVMLGCWVSAVLYFFGAKIVLVYGVIVSLLTHFLPLGPIALLVLIVAGIVAAVPRRVAD